MLLTKEISIKIVAKKEATLSQGYNFLFIIDKNYKELLDNI